MNKYSAEVYDSQVPQIRMYEIFSCGETWNRAYRNNSNFTNQIQ
jgi:hypothetical protein